MSPDDRTHDGGEGLTHAPASFKDWGEGLPFAPDISTSLAPTIIVHAVHDANTFETMWTRKDVMANTHYKTLPTGPDWSQVYRMRTIGTDTNLVMEYIYG